MSSRQKSRKLHTRSMVSVPFPVADGVRVVKAAELAGQPISAFIRDAALRRAEQILANPEQPQAAESPAA